MTPRRLRLRATGVRSSFPHTAYPMRNVTLALAALALLFAPEAMAQCTGTPGVDFQQVSVSEINQLPQANIDQLNAAGAGLTTDQIQSLVTNDLEGELVEFQAVVLTNPILSGLASATDGVPNRIHVFVRDTTALSQGPAGMDIQIVDGRTDRVETQNLFVGDEIVVCGLVAPFGSTGRTMQINPLSVTLAGTPVVDLTANPEFDDPIEVEISDFHREVDGLTQIRWENFSDFNSQYVRLSGVTIVQGVPGTRPNILFSEDAAGSHPQVNSYDTSVCYRNDRGPEYFPAGQAPSCIDEDFVPPPAGTADVQGFLTFSGWAGGFGYSVPNGANFSISPFEEEDFQVSVAPPTITLAPLAAIPNATDDVTIGATVVPGQGTIASVTVDYEYFVDGTSTGTGSNPLSNTSGDDYEGTIPAGADGADVVYTVTATDSEGESSSVTGSYRIIDGAVRSIRSIQETLAGGDASPLYFEANGDNNADDPIAFDLDATVQSIFQLGANWVGSIQDNADLDPWSGIWVFFGAENPGLSVGDQINITEAAINERFDVTQLEDVTFTTTASGSPYAYKTVETSVLTDADVAEAHEGMLIRFEDVTITNNDAGFGEWEFSSTGSAADAVRADDYTDAFDDFDPSVFFANGEVREFIQGIWYFSFGDYKLTPVELTDIGAISTAVEGGLEARSIRILGTAPNPARSTARIAFELDQSGPASLRVFDVTGREVAVLTEGTMAAGEHTAELSAGALSPGVYVVRLSANGEVATARLAVVR